MSEGVKEYVKSLVERSRNAQQIFETYDQKQVDKVVKAIGKVFYDNAEEYAQMALVESNMGDYDYKVKKIKNKAMATWYYLKDKKSVGIINSYDNGIVEVAKPMGVIGAICPVTNPVMTPLHNAMIVFKGRNSMIVCPHPSAKKTGVATVELMRKTLKEIGAPEDLILVVEEPTMEISTEVMSQTDVCISTGGGSVVKVAYKSGKPAYGVGAGNVQCLIDKDADLKDAIEKALFGRLFDNGISCTCEQFIHCQEEQYDEVVDLMKKAGALYVDDEKDLENLRNACFPGGKMNKNLVGKDVATVAKAAGLDLNGANVIVAKTKGPGAVDVLCREKMFPVLGFTTYKTWEDAVSNANANLDLDGKGHSVVLHSHTQEHIEYAANHIPVSRFLVNGIGSSGLGGAYTNGLVPTGTLGCGSWGNNSISENLGYIHLVNISRIAYTNPDAHIPTPEEIWAD